MHRTLGKLGLATLIRNECNKIVSFKINLDCFNPKMYIPPWKYGDNTENLVICPIELRQLLSTNLHFA